MEEKMKTVYLVTGNNGKVASLQRKLENYDIKVEQIKLDLFEIQSDDLKEVSVNKAKQAFEILKKPLVVDDSGFFIKELNGFPGVYTKYVLGSIGVDGIMDIMKNKNNRECIFKSVVTFVDTYGKTKVFEGDLEEGVIANEIDKEDRKEAWSELWKIFIPEGYNKTLSQFSPEERNERSSKRNGTTAFRKFAEWIVSNAEEKL